MAHGDDSLVAYEVVYDEVKEAIAQASAKRPFTADQQKAVSFIRRTMNGAQDRLKGRPEDLIEVIRELEEDGPELAWHLAFTWRRSTAKPLGCPRTSVRSS